jgi:DNA repair exonuclease SbcCD ATPase subunit
MSQASFGGSAVPSARASADEIVAMFKVLADPELHGKRLEQLAASEKSAEEARTAAAITQREILEERQALEKRATEIESWEERYRASAAALQARTAAADSAMNEREVALARRGSDHANRVRQVEAQLSAREKAVSEKETVLAATARELESRATQLSKQEKRIAAKLAKIKEFEEA